jgi:hypothetical protein
MCVTCFVTGPRVVFVGLCLTLGGLALACGPTAAPPPTPTPPDPFSVVRATAQAAYQEGKAALDGGDLIRGCPAIDTAKTNDPDNRADIQQALEQCLTQIPLLLATAAAPTSAPTPAQRTIVVATIPAAPAAPATPATPATPSAQPTAPPDAAANLVIFRDPQGRFSIGSPADWTRADQPQTLFGTGVVQFREPSGRAALAIAVDTSSKAVSPELYAAGMDIAMQQQVPGYAAEQVLPSSVSGNPALRRVFTFTQRDASGRDLQARAFQTVVIKGQTPYILMGSAPAEQFAQFSPMFDQMVESFRFS